MDPKEREAFEKSLNLQGEDEVFENVEKMVASMLQELEKKKSDPDEIRALQENLNQTLQEEQIEEELKEREKTLRERAGELARKWDELNLPPEEKDELIKRLLGIIEHMQTKFLYQKGCIEDQKRSIRRLAIQISTLRRKVQFKKRKTSVTEKQHRTSAVVGVLREHTRILQDCVLLMRRQILALKRRDQMCQDNGKKIFKDCYIVLSQQLSELKIKYEDAKDLSEEAMHAVLKECIQTLTFHLAELRRREETSMARDKKCQEIFKEYSELMKDHVGHMKERSGAGEAFSLILNDCVKFLAEHVTLLKKRDHTCENVEESAFQDCEELLESLFNDVVKVNGSGENEADAQNAFKIILEILCACTAKLQQLEQGRAEHKSGTNSMSHDQLQTLAELKELEDLTDILENEMNKQEEDLIENGETRGQVRSKPNQNDDIDTGRTGLTSEEEMNFNLTAYPAQSGSVKIDPESVLSTAGQYQETEHSIDIGSRKDSLEEESGEGTVTSRSPVYELGKELRWRNEVHEALDISLDKISQITESNQVSPLAMKNSELEIAKEVSHMSDFILNKSQGYTHELPESVSSASTSSNLSYLEPNLNGVDDEKKVNLISKSSNFVGPEDNYMSRAILSRTNKDETNFADASSSNPLVQSSAVLKDLQDKDQSEILGPSRNEGISKQVSTNISSLILAESNDNHSGDDDNHGEEIVSDEIEQISTLIMGASEEARNEQEEGNETGLDRNEDTLNQISSAISNFIASTTGRGGFDIGNQITSAGSHLDQRDENVWRHVSSTVSNFVSSHMEAGRNERIDKNSHERYRVDLEQVLTTPSTTVTQDVGQERNNENQRQENASVLEEISTTLWNIVASSPEERVNGHTNETELAGNRTTLGRMLPILSNFEHNRQNSLDHDSINNSNSSDKGESLSQELPNTTEIADEYYPRFARNNYLQIGFFNNLFQRSQISRREILLRWRTELQKLRNILIICASCYILWNFFLLLIPIFVHYLSRSSKEKGANCHWSFQGEDCSNYRAVTRGEAKFPKVKDQLERLKDGLEQMKSWRLLGVKGGQAKPKKWAFPGLHDKEAKDKKDWEAFRLIDWIPQKDWVLQEFEDLRSMFTRGDTTPNDGPLLDCLTGREEEGELGSKLSTSMASSNPFFGRHGHLHRMADEIYQKTLGMSYLAIFFTIYGITLFFEVVLALGTSLW